MNVETFEMSEVQDMTITEKEECLDLAKTLGLEGQQALINPEKTTSFAYRKATKEEAFVYNILLPENCKVEEFRESQIPLRVLQVLAHAESLDFFNEFTVSYSTNADIKDPVLWGMKQVGEYNWNKERYILARWGEVLEPFSELQKTAAERFRATALDQIRQFKDEVESFYNLFANCSIDTIIHGTKRQICLSL